MVTQRKNQGAVGTHTRKSPTTGKTFTVKGHRRGARSTAKQAARKK